MRSRIQLLLLITASAWALLLCGCSTAWATNKQLAAGQDFFNFVQLNGQVFSWGNALGLGRGTNMNAASSPVLMQGVVAATDISAGEFHACLVENGAVKCTGDNSRMQLGLSDLILVQTLNVLAVSQLTTGVQEVFCGHYFSCALLKTNALHCWGQNMDGQLGINSWNLTVLPTQSAVDVLTAAAGGNHLCIIHSGTGRVSCAGLGNRGQLGDGSIWGAGAGFVRSSVFSPVLNLPTDKPAASIAAGEYHTCAVMQDGAVFCWGANNLGQLGDTSNVDRALPVGATGLGAGSALSVTAGYQSTCVILRNGNQTAACFGEDTNGKFGNNVDPPISYNNKIVYGQLQGQILQLQLGNNAACMLEFDGSVRCAGLGAGGQLGQGNFLSSKVLLKVNSILAVRPPTRAPTNAPTLAPTLPTRTPTKLPTSLAPTSLAPTFTPSKAPTMGPTKLPTLAPTFHPTLRPTHMPTHSPTMPTTMQPSLAPTPAPSISPTPPDFARCLLSYGMTRAQCTKQATFCRSLNIDMQWTGTGCRINGKRQKDGGCRCADYCGFKCKKACNNNSKCVWHSTLKACTHRATGKVYVEQGDGYCRS